MVKYRPDIDGLRAIAVLSVVAFHAIPAAMPGGFIGVDIFFVISGYLITKLIAVDIEQQRFSVVGFYVRRTKRIFPALFVMLFCVLALGMFLLTPTELKGLGRTTAATAGFVSNLAFWQDTGYFDTAAESKPLLHTWSLAVEEQFYVVWPLTLLILHRRHHARAIVLSIIGVSFFASCYLTIHDQSTAFFLLPPRSWELLTGAALALGMLPRPRSRAQRDIAAVLGLALIVAGLVMLDRSSLFPGWNALAPCLGAAFIIAAGEGGDNFVAERILSRRPVVFVGLISYSMYLWHWPLLSLARIVERGHLSTGYAMLVVAFSIALSVVTWRFVELPLRAKGAIPAAAPVLLRYALVSVSAVAIGIYVYSADGFMNRASPELFRAEAARYDVNRRSGVCLRWQAAVGPLPFAECMFDQERFPRRLVVWGDSHADAATPGLQAFASAHGYATHQLTMAGCPPLVGAQVAGVDADYGPCSAFNSQVLEYVTSDSAVEVVVLSARWTLYTEASRFGDDPGPVNYLTDDLERHWSSLSSKRVFVRALESTISSLRRAGRNVIVLGTIPPLGVNVPACLARNHMPFSGVRACDVDAEQVLQHLIYADRWIEKIAAADPNVCTYFPKRALCPNGRCLATSGQDILYANDDHLTVAGSMYLARFFDFDSCLSVGAAATRDDLHAEERSLTR